MSPEQMIDARERECLEALDQHRERLIGGSIDAAGSVVQQRPILTLGAAAASGYAIMTGVIEVGRKGPRHLVTLAGRGLALGRVFGSVLMP